MTHAGVTPVAEVASPVMDEPLEGEAAAAYVAALMEAGNTGTPFNAAALARDARRAQFSGRALERLRLAGLTRRVVPNPPRPAGVRPRPRGHHGTPRVRPSKPAGASSRPRRSAGATRPR